MFYAVVNFFLRNIPPLDQSCLSWMAMAHMYRISLLSWPKLRNSVHLLCLPSQTTHILQPLNVGVFKSFKSKACSGYLAANPERAITNNKLVSLAAEAWPHSFTAVNIMSGCFQSTVVK